MKAVRLGLVVCLVVLVASCTLKPTWDVIGKWEKVEGNETLEFLRNGTVNLTAGPTSLTTAFTFTDPKHLQIPVGGLGTFVLEVSIAADTLSLTDANGKVSKFRKVK